MDAESSETFRALANFVVARCANPLATTVSPRGAASAASSRAMRRDARGPSSTNSAYGQFYERPSVPATGARDITYARSGADASHPDPRASAGRRAHAASGREAPAQPASLDHIPAVVVKAADAGRPVGAFTGAVGRTGGRRARSGTFETANALDANALDAPSPPRTTRDGDFLERRGFASGSGERLETFRPTEAATLGRPFARVGVARVGPASAFETDSAKTSRHPPRGRRAAFASETRTQTKYPYETRRRPEWNASFATGSKDEARLSRVGADARLSARAAEERRRFGDRPRRDDANDASVASRRDDVYGVYGSSNDEGSFLTASTAFDRVGRRVASLHDAMGTRRTESVSPLDAADRALGAALETISISRDDSVSKKSVSKNPSASATRASLDRAAASLASSSSKSSFENLRGGLSGGSGGSGARLASGSTRITGASFANDPSPSPTVSAVARRRDAAPTSMYSAARCAGTATLAGGVNGVAKENQDSFFIVPGGEANRLKKNAGDFAAGVLDGHGADGRRVSKFVAAKIKASLERYFASSVVASSNSEIALDALEDAVVAAFAEADAALRAAPRGSVEHEESGCTCVVVVRRGETLLTANVGDSRAVLCGAPNPRRGFGSSALQNESAVQFLDLSSDHKPDRPDERARIERTGVGCVERARDGFFWFAGPHRVWLKSTPRSGGLAVSRAFGDTRLARAGVTPTPEITVTDIRHPGTHGVDAPLCVVLASDGVWDHVSSAAAAAAAAAAFGSLGPKPRMIDDGTSRAADAYARMSDPSDALARDAKAAADAIAAKAVAGWRGAANGGYRDDITVAVAPLIR